MDRTDIFLSYRRADVEFTQKLYQQLRATDRAVWVDWENLPPGVEGFSNEIQRGIEAADAFVCVLSPEYLQSEYCLMELQEALKLKKRVIPLVARKFEPLPPPEGIGHINWIYFTPHAGQKNEFEDAFPRVIKALEADYEHAREHTRLLLRAMDWQRNDRNNSYLLKGAEIEKAERWQVAAVGKNPAPAELQGEYILASRAYQRRYQRRLTAVFGVLTVIAIVAAIFAWVQRNNAVISEQNAVVARDDAVAQEAIAKTQQALAESAEATAVAAKEEADEQRAVAESERQNALISGLAAQSQLTQSRQLGILLALEGYEESEKKGESNPAVETSLRSALVDFTGLPVHSYSTGASFVQFVENGDRRWLVSASEVGRVQISDTSQGPESEPFTLIESGLRNIMVSPDNQWLAGVVNAVEGQQIRLWALNDLQAGPITLDLPENARRITALSFSSAATSQYWLAVGLEDGHIYRWDLNNLPQADRELIKQIPDRRVTAVAFSPNSLWMAAAFGPDPLGAIPFLNIWEMQNLGNETLPVNVHGEIITHLEFASSSKWLAGAADGGNQLHLWNMATGSRNPPAQVLQVEAFNDVAFSPNERWVAVAQQAKVEVWDLKKLFREGLELPGYRDLALTVEFSHDSRLLATGDADGQLHLWDTADFSDGTVDESQARIYNSFDVTVNSLAFNLNDSQLAAAGDEQVRLWNFPETLSAPVRIDNPLRHSSLRDALLVQPSSDRLFAMDLKGQDPAIVLETERPGDLVYFTSLDERYLAVISTRQIEIWDLQNPAAPIFDPGPQDGKIIAPTFTADNRWFIYAIYDKIYALDLRQPASAIQLEGNRNGSPFYEFYTVDHWLFSKSSSEVLAWDTAVSPLTVQTKVSTSGGVPVAHPPSDDSSWIFTQQSRILSAWNTAEPAAEPIHLEGIFWEAIDNRWLITISEGNRRQLRDLSAPSSVLAEFNNYKISPSRRWLFYRDTEGVLQLLDLASPVPQAIPVESSPGSDPVFSPNDEWLVIPSREGDALALYDLANDMQMSELSGTAVSLFSPDGRWLVTTSTNDGSFFLYDLTDELSPVELPADHTPASFSPDNHWLILNADNGETALFDLQTGELFGETFPANKGLEVSPDGKWLYGILSANSGTDALLIDLDDPGNNLPPLRGHTDELIGVDFTADGRFLLTYGNDRTIRIWDLQNLAADPVVLRHEEPVQNVQFSENGKWLLAETTHGIYIWPWNVDDVRELACRLVGRNLTQDEWTKYVGGAERERTCQEWE